MKRLLVLAIIATCVNYPSFGQTAICDKGFQQYDGVCISQRMLEYLVCVKATGANKQQVSDIVRQVTKDKYAGAAAGKGAGVVFSGAVKAELVRDTDREIVKKLETTFFPGGTSHCRAVLDEAPSAPKKVSFQMHPQDLNEGWYMLKNTGAASFNTTIEFAEYVRVGLAGEHLKGTKGTPLVAISLNGSYPRDVSDSGTEIRLNATNDNLVRIARSVEAFAAQNGIDGVPTVLYEFGVFLKYDDENGASHKRAWHLLRSVEKSGIKGDTGLNSMPAGEFDDMRSLEKYAKKTGMWVSAESGKAPSAQKISCGLTAALKGQLPAC